MLAMSPWQVEQENPRCMCGAWTNCTWVGQAMHPRPVDRIWPLYGVVADEFSDFRLSGGGVRLLAGDAGEVVAEAALRDRGHGGRLVRRDRPVAELAIQSRRRHVHRVGERDGLRRPVAESENRGRLRPPRLDDEVADERDDESGGQPDDGDGDLD